MELKIIYAHTPVLLQTYKSNWNIIPMPQIHGLISCSLIHIEMATRDATCLGYFLFSKSTLEVKKGS